MQVLVNVVTQLSVAALLSLLCVAVQTVVNIALLSWVLRVFAQLDHHFGLLWRVSIIVRLIFAFLGIHLLQIGCWAVGYRLLGCFASNEEALYFSLASFSTSEAGDSRLPQHWRLLGPSEGLAGIIALGLSVGFMFTVINRMNASRILHYQAGKGESGG